MNNQNNYRPFISVIIPFYNVGEYARPCMESLLRQDYEKCEFICVDDGSTDNTPDILKEYDSDVRVKILHKKNGGLSSARNYGLDNAKGDFVTFVDGDDFVHPQYLNSLVAATEGNKNRLVISPLRLVRYTDKLDTKTGWTKETTYKKLEKRTTFEKILYDELSVSACAKLVPISAYQDIRFPYGMVSEEVAIIGKIIRKFDDISIVEQPLYGYVMRVGSIGHKKSFPYKDIQDRLDALRILEEIIKDEFDINSSRELKLAIQYRWGWRFVDMAPMYDRVYDDKEAICRLKYNVKKWLKQNVRELISNKRAPVKQRLRILFYTYAPFFYQLTYSCYQKLKYNV